MRKQRRKRGAEERSSPFSVPKPAAGPQEGIAVRPVVGLAGFALVVLVIAVFGRAVSFDFVNLDDNSNLKKNPAMHDLRQAWERPYLDAYLPVVYTAWHGLCAVSQRAQVQGQSLENWTPIPELNPAVFHAANLALHAINAVLVFMVIRSLFPALSPLLAAMLAALFALHPLQVEPVAWVTALKDVLSATFSLLVILLFVRSPSPSLSARQLAVLSGVFLLACLSKSTQVFLPLWLTWLGCVHWRIPWPRVATRLWPLFAIAAAVTLIAVTAQPDPKDMVFQEIWRRPLVAGDALAFYAGKLVWPARLALDYGRNPRFLFESGAVYLTGGLGLAAIVVVWWFRRRVHPWLLLGLGGVVLTLLPVLGLKPFVFQTISTVSDRYMYLSTALLLVGVTPLLSRVPPVPVTVVLALLATASGVRSWQQLPVWRNSASLWRHTLSLTPDSGVAHNNLAAIYEQLGRLPEAIRHYELSTRRLPLAQTCARTAILYSDLQDWQKAREWNEKGLALDPFNVLMLNNRAVFNERLQRVGGKL